MFSSGTIQRSSHAANALLWSVVVHLIAVMLAAAPVVREAVRKWQTTVFAEKNTTATASQSSPREMEIIVPEVTVVQAPLVESKPEQFIRTDGLTETAPDPGKSRFISDRDTRAASSTPAQAGGVEGQISQEGVDVPVVEVIRADQSNGESEAIPPGPDSITQVASVRTETAALREPLESLPISEEKSREPTKQTIDNATHTSEKPQPDEIPKEPDLVATTKNADVTLATVEKKEKPTPLQDQKSLTESLREPTTEARPNPPEVAVKQPPSRSATPPTAPAGFSSQRQPTRLHGTISNQGSSSVDAENTPTGRYMKQVTSAIEKEWHRKRLLNRDFVTYGTIQLVFYVNSRGQVHDISIKNREGANPIMQDFTLNAVLDAKIPSMPSGLTDLMDQDRLQISYDIIVY